MYSTNKTNNGQIDLPMALIPLNSVRVKYNRKCYEMKPDNELVNIASAQKILKILMTMLD
jgi:hypothetical protein